MKKVISTLFSVILLVSSSNSFGQTDYPLDAFGIQDLFRIWNNQTQNYYGPGLALATMADHSTCSWGNSGMKDLSSEPRMPFNNDPGYAYAYITMQFWNGMYQIIDTANFLLAEIGNTINFGSGGEYNDFAIAWAYFNRGIAYGYVSLLFDKALQYSDSNVDKLSLPFHSCSVILDSALLDLEEAASRFDAATDQYLPDGWINGLFLSNVEMASLCRSFIARLLIYSPRNSSQAVDWNRIANNAQNGLYFNLEPVMDDNSWIDWLTGYMIHPTWLRVDHRVINLMDPDYPFRWPYDNVSWDTPDGNDPGPATSGDPRLESDFMYQETNNFMPDRGFYHFSHYRFSRYDYFLDNGWTGPMSIFSSWETDLILAEALVHLGDFAGAIAVLNDAGKPRIVRGGFAPLSGGETAEDILDVIYYERDLELIATGMGISFFDMRRRDALQKGTLLHFPVPGAVLEERGDPVYTFGGEMNADGVNTAVGDKAWDDGFYFTVDKPTCDYGLNDWLITIQPPLSNPPYEYSIDNGVTFSTNNVFSGLGNDTYFLRVKDNLGNVSFLKTVTMDELQVYFNTTNSCYEEYNGRIISVVIGGVPPYHYQWSTGETGYVISNLEAGIYTLTVTDGLGCSVFATDTVYEEAEILTPVIEGPDEVEYYSQAWFSTPETEGVEYVWSCPEGQIIANLNDSILVLFTNPVDSVHVTVRSWFNGCYSLPQTKTIGQGSIMNNALNLFHDWLTWVQGYNGPGMAMGVMADEHTSSWNNSGMRDLSSEPRNEYNNSPIYSYFYITGNYWPRLYNVIYQARDILLQLDSIPDDPEYPEYKIMMKAWAYFNLGISHGYLGLVFDKAHIIGKTTDLENLSFDPYTNVVNAATGYLDECISLCNQGNFTLPDEFSPGFQMNETSLRQVANSMAARLLVYQSRNQIMNASTDWAKVLNYCYNGFPDDIFIHFGTVGNEFYETEWRDEITYYQNLEVWGRIDYRIIHLLDSDYPYRWPDDNVSWDTPDGLDPMEASSPDARLLSDFEFIETIPFVPERGYYHFSHYRYTRYDEYIITWDGYKPIFLKAELDMIMAEAHLRLGNNAAAINIINNGSRINRGYLPPLSGSETAQEVLDAIFYERDIELISSSMGIGYFDLRRRDMHQKGTPLHFPVPAPILINYGEEVYTYGAEFRADGWNTADGMQAWDSAFYVNIGKETCLGTDNWSLEFEVTDGLSPHQYSINGGASYQSSNLFTGLTPGMYTVAVMNSLGEVKVKEVYIEELYAETFSQDVCFESDVVNYPGVAPIFLEASGGIPPYTYLWSEGTTSRDLYDAPAGIYTVEVTDQAGCVVTITDTINLLPEIISPEIEGPEQVEPGSQAIYSVLPKEETLRFLWNVYGGTPENINLDFNFNDTIRITWDNPMPDSAFVRVAERSVSGCYSNFKYLYVNLPEPEQHFTTVWEGNGVDHMNFYALTARLDDEDLQPGDEIGIFDGDYCVGAGVLEEVLVEGVNYLSMVASKNDADYPAVNGFTPGNEVSYKVWDVSEQKEIDRVEVTYITGDGTFSIGGTATFHLSSSSQVEQVISLDDGWNIMSFNVIPDDMSMQTILQPLIDGVSLIKVQDETGQAIENVVPIGWIFNIDQMANTEGYKIKVNGNVNQVTLGYEVQLPFNIPLVNGWNIMGYPAMQSQAAIAALDALINEGSLLKVQNEQGQAIENVVPIGWVDNIGNFVPGEGYKIKVSQNTSITIDVSLIKSMPSKGVLPEPKHFIPVWDGNGLDHMNLYITSATLGEIPLMAGDEIGVFTDQLCVGYGVVTKDRVISLVASLDDPTTPEKDGFVDGDRFELRAWIAASEQEAPVEEMVVIPGYSESLEKMGTTVLEARFDPTGLLQTGMGRIYPNPFSDKTSIHFTIGKDAHTKIEIYNTLGQKIAILKEEILPAGYYTIEWDGIDGSGNKLAPGTYLLKMIAGNYTSIDRLIIK